MERFLDFYMAELTYVTIFLTRNKISSTSDVFPYFLFLDNIVNLKLYPLYSIRPALLSKETCG